MVDDEWVKVELTESEVYMLGLGYVYSDLLDSYIVELPYIYKFSNETDGIYRTTNMEIVPSYISKNL